MNSKVSSSKLLVLIDGSSYLHRAYHALPELATTHGQPTGAIYGVINMIRKLIHDYDPSYIAVIFDAKGKNFRHELYPEYKAHRVAMPDDLISQIKPLHEIITAMGLPLITISGVEADDVIGTLVKKAKHAGIPVVISTGDKDMAQLVDKDVTLVNTMSDKILDIDGVKEKFGVAPEQMIDYLALVGDTSDNIKGVPMIGPKTAVKLLQEYHSLDGIIQHADKVTGKIGENLREYSDKLPLACKLVEIKQDVPLDYEIKDLQRQAPHNEKLIELFKHLEFKSWLASLLSDQPKPKKRENNYQLILNPDDFAKLIKKLHTVKSFAFDLETTSLDIIDAQIVGISFAFAIGESCYTPVGHDYLGAPKQLDRKEVLNQLQPIFENKHIHKLGQNLKYDMGVLANYAINLQGVEFDTMLESYILNSSENRNDKETLALKYLDEKIITFEDVAGKGAKKVTFNQVKIEEAFPYAAQDPDLVLRFHKILWKEIEEHPKLVKVFHEIDMPLVGVLSRMERNGVCIDENLLTKQSKHLEKQLQKIEVETYKIAGQEFNLGSPLQLQEVLFKKLKLPVLHKTPTGQPSTAEQTLQELSLDYPLPKLILEYRSLSKLKSTYTDALPQQINPKTKRVHTSYNQAVTVTGRLSSTDPNLQNIPARTEEGREIRQAFVAPKGYKIISADYSQIELRIMAHLSEDKNLMHAFANNHDIHQATAAEIFGIPFKDVTPEQRQRAKTINFGLIYGMSAFGLAQRLGLERAAAQGYIDTYFQRYPNVRKYMNEIRAHAEKMGYVETIFGRRIYVPHIKAKNFSLRSAAERAAINAPMQGTAADIMKVAMINVDEWLCENHAHIDAKMIMQVHDELVFEVKESDVKKVTVHVKEFMENAAKLAVPVLVHVGVGDNWEEAH